MFPRLGAAADFNPALHPALLHRRVPHVKSPRSHWSPAPCMSTLFRKYERVFLARTYAPIVYARNLFKRASDDRRVERNQDLSLRSRRYVVRKGNCSRKIGTHVRKIGKRFIFVDGKVLNSIRILMYEFFNY